MKLENKVALITGGGGGIGRATAQIFADEGARVVLADIRLDHAEEAAQAITSAGGEALAIEVDVTQKPTVDAMFAQAVAAFGQIDILVNNAGASRGDDILSIDEETWDFNIDLVLKGTYLCSQAVLPGMIERRWGAIVNISSVNGMTGIGEEPYAAAKAGMINLTQNMAIKYSPSGVRTNCIAPGTIRTPVWGERLRQDPQVFERLTAWYPLGRVGEPEDVAKAALFLASDDAAWITGVTLPVDGGLLAGNYRMNRALQAKADEEPGS